MSAEELCLRPLPDEAKVLLSYLKIPARLSAHLALVCDAAHRLLGGISSAFPALYINVNLVLFGATGTPSPASLIPNLSSPKQVKPSAEICSALSISSSFVRASSIIYLAFSTSPFMPLKNFSSGKSFPAPHRPTSFANEFAFRIVVETNSPSRKLAQLFITHGALLAFSTESILMKLIAMPFSAA